MSGTQDLSNRVNQFRSAQTGIAYVAGNTMAIIFGLSAAFWAMLRGHNISPDTTKTGDFIAYFSGARMVLTGHGNHLYDLHALAQSQTSLFRPLVAPQGILLPYLYMPFLAVLQAPLAALSYNAGFCLWLLLNVVMLVTMLFAIERYAHLQGRPAFVARFATIASLPVLLCLFNGQTSILIACLLTASFVALRANRPAVAGLALAFATIKLPYILPLLLVLCLRRQWRVLAAYTAGMVVLVVGAGIFLEPGTLWQYVRTLQSATQWSTQFGYAPARNESLAGLADLMFYGWAALLVRVALSLAVLGMLVRSSWRCTQIDIPLALAVVAALLVSPHVLVHDLVLLVLPVSVLLRHTRNFTFLTLGYLAVLLGYWLAFREPVQLATVAMGFLAFGIYRLGIAELGTETTDAVTWSRAREIRGLTA